VAGAAPLTRRRQLSLSRRRTDIYFISYFLTDKKSKTKSQNFRIITVVVVVVARS
jgi:hypothetical protein